MSSDIMQQSAYLENLKWLTERSNGKLLLNFRETAKLLDLKDSRAVKEKFPFVNGYISLATLARCMPLTKKDG